MFNLIFVVMMTIDYLRDLSRLIIEYCSDFFEVSSVGFQFCFRANSSEWYTVCIHSLHSRFDQDFIVHEIKLDLLRYNVMDFLYELESESYKRLEAEVGNFIKNGIVRN